MSRNNVSPKSFSALSGVYNGQLAAAVQASLQYQAKVSAAAVADLTDNSGGATADGVLPAVPLGTPVANAAATKGVGEIDFAGQPSANDTVTVDSEVTTFVASGATTHQCNIGADLATTITNLIAKLTANVATVVATSTQAGKVTITAASAGASGNSIALAKSGTNISVSGATLAGGTDGSCPSKSSVETGFGTARDALTELEAKIIALNPKVPVRPIMTANIGGTSADGTIGSVTKSYSGAGSTLVAAAGFNALAASYRDALATLQYEANAIAYACGAGEATGETGGQASYDGEAPALSTGTGTAVDGSDALTHASVSVADVNAFFTAIADGVKEVAAKLNACTTDTAPVPSVFAVAR